MAQPNQTEQAALALVKDEKQADLTLTGELDIDRYIGDAPPEQRTVQALNAWRVHQREKMTAKVLRGLAITFAATIAACFLYGAVTLFNPDLKNEFFIETAPDIVKTEATLLATAFGTYCLSSKRQKDEQKQ